MKNNRLNLWNSKWEFRAELALARAIEVFDIVEQLCHGIVALRIKVDFLAMKLYQL